MQRPANPLRTDFIARVLLFGATSLGLSACSPATTRPSRSAVDEPRDRARGVSATTERTLTERAIRLAPVLVAADAETSTAQRLARAFRLWESGNPGQAARAFDELSSYDPRGAIAAELGYWAATAYEDAAAYEPAALRFERVRAHFPQHYLARDAELRAVRLWGFLEQWQRSAALAARALAADEAWLPSAEVALHSACALALLETGEYERADYHIGKGRQIASRAGLDRLDSIPRDLAQLYFAMGELRRARGTQIAFDPLPPDFGEQFERRAQWLLDAQSAYLDAMRARDAHWTVMAGVRIGQLYQELHDDVQRAPLPPSLPPTRVRLFQDAVRLRYLVLLEKGLAMYRQTLRVAERTGEDSRWVANAREQARQLELRLANENAALDNSRYTRPDLARVLDGIQALQQEPDSRARSAHPAKPEAH